MTEIKNLKEKLKKEKIHFAHANSFPAQTYRKIFALLEEDFEVNFLAQHAHNPSFPVMDGWRELKDELREDIENRYDEPIIGIGHSLGGILHFLVAVEKPSLYKSIILLDSPLVGKWKGAALRLVKKLGVRDKYMPSGAAEKRRRHWKSKAEAEKHFERKFPHFDAEVLHDYIEFGITDDENGGVTLAFLPEIEAEIYRTIPDNFTALRGKLKVPAGYIGGKSSREAKLAGLEFMRKSFPFRFEFLEGSHLFPFEKPAETATAIREMIKKL